MTSQMENAGRQPGVLCNQLGGWLHYMKHEAYMTEGDRTELQKIHQEFESARLARRRVITRIRNRAWRARKTLPSRGIA